MCNHIFMYPEDKPENYNNQSQKLMGVCKCGAIQDAYGLRWSIRKEERFLGECPFGEDKLDIRNPIW